MHLTTTLIGTKIMQVRHMKFTRIPYLCNMISNALVLMSSGEILAILLLEIALVSRNALFYPPFSVIKKS